MPLRAFAPLDWILVVGYLAVALLAGLVVARRAGRRSCVLTDAELVELRYSGRPARFLRGFKAIFFAVLINGIVLGWVIRAMTKISEPFAVWQSWPGADRYAALSAG